MAESSTNNTEFAKKAAACDIVRFTFTDINGLPRTKLVPGPQTSYFIQSGVASWAAMTAIGTQSLIFPKEVQAINEGNATAIPDPQTFHEVIWSSEEDLKIGEVCCCCCCLLVYYHLGCRIFPSGIRLDCPALRRGSAWFF